MTKTLDKTIKAGLVIAIEGRFQNAVKNSQMDLTDAVKYATDIEWDFSSVLGAYDYNIGHAVNAWKRNFLEGSGSTERHVSDVVTAGLIEAYTNDLTAGTTPEAPPEAPKSDMIEMHETLDKKGLVLNEGKRLTNPKDSFLLYIRVYSERKGEHIVYTYNTQTKGLTNGYYTNDERTAIKRYNALTA